MGMMRSGGSKMKRLTLLLCLLGTLLLAACGGTAGTGPGAAAEEPEDLRLSDFSKPPELLVRCGGQEAAAVQTTYSWSLKEQYSPAPHVEADGIHPLQMLDTEGRIEMTPLSVPDGAEVELVFPLMPEKVTVNCWPEETAHAIFRDGAQFFDALEQAVELNVSEGRVTPPGKGSFIYEVMAKWRDGSGNGGTAYYGFYTTG